MISPPRDFDAEAATWDEVEKRRHVAAAVAAGIIQHLPLQPSWRVLDVGCGTGLVTLALAPHAGPVVALDHSAAMLAELRRKLAPGAAPQVTPVHGSLDSWTDPTADFDLIVCTQTLTHVASIDATLAQIRLRLRPGGRIALAEMDGGPISPAGLGCRREELAHRVQAAGFIVATVADVITFPGPGAVAASRRQHYYVLTAALG